MNKNNNKTKQERKEKFKKILFFAIHGLAYTLSALFVAVCIIGCATRNNNKHQASPSNRIRNDIVLVCDDLSNIIYDNTNFEIEFTLDELQNYTWNNLQSYLQAENGIIPNINLTTIDYNEHTYLFDEIALNDNRWEILYSYSLDNTSISFYGDNTFVFISDDNLDEFEYGFVWNLDENNYYDIKQAIELDIQANGSTPSYSIFGGITETIVDFVSTLNVGLTSTIALFWNSSTSNLTPLGLLTAIVVSVSISYFIFRLVIGLIRLRG